ncbi:MAG: radical SAM protein [Candidatus Omnitrophota bacterium]
MFDIGFYQKIYDLKYRLMGGEKVGRDFLWEMLEQSRSRTPVVYNIETTNACNMKCAMCPRTTMMTRKIETMSLGLFEKVVDQLSAFSNDEWGRWQDFAEAKYKVSRQGMSENHFFLYVIPKVIVLHGYGDPLLDKYMPERVKMLTERGIESYFSCNPANISIDKTLEMFENGLGYIKYSVESVDDMKHKKIRGEASDFSKSYEKICRLLKYKKDKMYKTAIVITMLNLYGKNQEAEFVELKKAFEGQDVYLYLKSQDQQWYQKEYYGTKSIHWLEFCQFPWSSMTVKSNGEAAMCVEDFNNEIILGDCGRETLADIWNGPRYERLRRDHFNKTPGIKCTEQCDMKLFNSCF